MLSWAPSLSTGGKGRLTRCGNTSVSPAFRGKRIEGQLGLHGETYAQTECRLFLSLGGCEIARFSFLCLHLLNSHHGARSGLEPLTLYSVHQVLGLLVCATTLGLKEDSPQLLCQGEGSSRHT